MSSVIKIKFVGDAKQFNRTLSSTQKALNGFKRAAKLGGAAIAGALAVGVSKSVTSFASFEEALTRSQSIMGDLTTGEMAAMETAARTLGTTTRFSAQEGADAFYFLASAGLAVDQQLAALPLVADFAQAGMFDLSQATDLLTDAQSALGLSSDDASVNLENMTRLADVLVRSSSLANASVEEFSTSLTTKAATAMATWNVHLEEGVAVLAVLADKGVKGEKAGTNFSMMLTNMTTAAVTNKEAFEELGVAVFDNQGNVSGLADIIEDLEIAFEGLSAEEKKEALLQLGFADRAQQTVFALLGTSDSIREYTGELETAGGVTAEVADKQLEPLAAKFDLLKGKLEDVAITVGAELAPALSSAMGFFSDLADAWSPAEDEFQWSGPTEKLEGLAGVIAFLDEKSTLIIPSLVALAGVIAGVMIVGTVALIAAMSPLVLTVAGITIAVVALTAGFTYLYRENETFRTVVDKVIDAVGWLWDKVNGVVGAIGGWTTVLAVLAGPIGIAVLAVIKFRDQISSLWGIMKTVASFISDTAVTAWDALVTAFGWVSDKVTEVSDSVTEFAGFITKLPGKIGEGITTVFRTLANKAVGFINDIIAGYNKVAKWIPGLPQIDLLPEVPVPEDFKKYEEPFKEGFKGVNTAWQDEAKESFHPILGAASTMVDDVKAKNTELIDDVGGLKKRIGDEVASSTPFHPILGDAIGIVTDVDDEFGKIAAAAGHPLKDAITNKVSNPFHGVKVASDQLVKHTDNRNKKIVDSLGRPLQTAITRKVSNPFHGVKIASDGSLSHAKDRNTKIVGNVKGLKGRIDRASSGMFNGAIEASNRAWNHISGRRVPGWGGTTTATNLGFGTRFLAKGGLITKPTLSVVGEGGESEIVSPIPTMRKTMEDALDARFGTGATVTGGSGGGGIHIGEVNMNTDADIGDLSRELRWLQVTQGAR